MKRKKSRRIPLTKPGNDEQEYEMTVTPFKEARRKGYAMPLRRGQGVSISGWQFEVRGVQPNGSVNLKMIGKIKDTEEVSAGGGDD